MKRLLFILAIFAVTAIYFSKDASSQEAVSSLLSKANIEVNGKKPHDIQVHDNAFYQRVLADGSLGLGESYMDGMWDAENVDETIHHILSSHVDSNVTPSIPMALAYLKASLFNLQDKIGAKEVIDQHYQLGNDLFEKMLDPYMMYTCGYFKDTDSLERAQEQKLDLICRKLQLKPGMKVLDIGCGWGGFEAYAAKNYGVEVLGVTLSENQAEIARKRCKELPVEIRIQDYRDVEGQFDAVLSIGMFEHVGSKNYREYFEVCDRVLKPGGLMLLHTIGRNTTTITCDPWIQKYIFANGQLPSQKQIAETSEDLFVMEDWHNFGADYDKTLLAWHKRFTANWPELSQNYNDRFYRMFSYYLLSCAGAFRAREIQLWQVVFSKDGVPGGYSSVR